MAGTLSFDKTTYQRLKKEYQNSIKNNIEVFVFDGHEILTAYAKYLLEYLKSKFEN
jgi:hypothetical protein